MEGWEGEKARMANLRKIPRGEESPRTIREFPVPREQTCSISNGWEQPRKGLQHLWWWVKGAEAGGPLAAPCSRRAAQALAGAAAAAPSFVGDSRCI